MDKMDNYLSRLPDHPFPDELPKRICLALRERRKKQCRIRRFVSGLLALGGIWMVIPVVTEYFNNLSLPSSGLPWLFNAVETLFYGAQDGVALAIQILFVYQIDITAAIKAPSVFGLAFLSVSALLAIDQILPRTN